MKSQAEINAEIQGSRGFFNLDAEQEETLDSIAFTGGNSNFTDDTESGLALPLSEAMETLKFREHPTWIAINEILTTLWEDNYKESQDDLLGREERLSAMDKAAGLKKALTSIGLIFSEAEQRMQTLSSDDKLRLGPEGNKMAQEVSRKPEFVLTPLSTSKLTVEDVKRYTEKAVAFLSQKPA